MAKTNEASFTATEFARWLGRTRVSASEIARRIGKSGTSVADIRKGKQNPSDAMKIAIATVTREIEAELGIVPAIGVPVESWFPRDVTREGALEAQQQQDSKAAG